MSAPILAVLIFLVFVTFVFNLDRFVLLCIAQNVVFFLMDKHGIVGKYSLDIDVRLVEDVAMGMIIFAWGLFNAFWGLHQKDIKRYDEFV